MTASKVKVLFIGEGATLAHVARPVLLARQLDKNRFDVTVARPDSFAWLTKNEPFKTLDIWSQESKMFADRLDRGQPLYDFATLNRYVEDDLALLDSEKPDIVVGDFRLSLAVSARMRSVPFVTICDAYWSPGYPVPPPLPVLPLTRIAPIPVAEFIFRRVAPFAFRLHAIPIKRLYERYGRPSQGYDLRRCYTDADLRLFANFQDLFPEVETSEQAQFIGPLAWSPADVDVDLTGDGKPLIYVTMGSSGDPTVLATLIPILARTGAEILVASAGKPLPEGLNSPSVKIFDYLPGDQVCQRARLVVCNGGSPTTNQALINGVPVLGIPRNMDQFLNMGAIERFGAGLQVRADRADEARLNRAINQLFGESRFGIHAAQLAKAPEKAMDGGNRLANHVIRLLARTSPTAA